MHFLFVAMNGVAQGYLAFVLTGSAAALGVTAFTGTVPGIFFASLGGYVADRWPRKYVLMWMQVFQLVTALAMGTLIATGLIEFWHLLVYAVTQSFGMSMQISSRQAWIPSLVPREDMAQAIAINQAGQNLTRIIGPALAGMLIGIPWFGVEGLYYTRTVSCALVLITFTMIPINGVPDTTRKRGNILQEMLFGYKYVFQHDALPSLFTYALVVTILGLAYQALLPAFALGVFMVGAQGLGVMQTAVAGGALAGSLSMAAVVSHRPDKAKLQAFAGALLGLSLVLFGVCALTGLFLPALATLAVVGFAVSTNDVLNSTLVMLNSEQAVYGRVMSVYQVVQSFAPLSASIFGSAMDNVGGGPVMIGIGATVTLFVLAMSLLHPGYKRIRETIT